MCVWASYSHSIANFFLAPTRAWELLLGSLVALGVGRSLASHRRPRRARNHGAHRACRLRICVRPYDSVSGALHGRAVRKCRAAARDRRPQLVAHCPMVERPPARVHRRHFLFAVPLACPGLDLRGVLQHLAARASADGIGALLYLSIGGSELALRRGAGPHSIAARIRRRILANRRGCNGRHRVARRAPVAFRRSAPTLRRDGCEIAPQRRSPYARRARLYPTDP